jgi:hypothetical protein
LINQRTFEDDSPVPVSRTPGVQRRHDQFITVAAGRVEEQTPKLFDVTSLGGSTSTVRRCQDSQEEVTRRALYFWEAVKSADFTGLRVAVGRRDASRGR